MIGLSARAISSAVICSAHKQCHDIRQNDQTSNEMSLKTIMVSLQLLSRVSNKHSCMSPPIKQKDEKSKEGVLKVEYNTYTKFFVVIFLLASEREKARVVTNLPSVFNIIVYFFKHTVGNVNFFSSTETIQTVRNREPRTATSTFTQLLSSEMSATSSLRISPKTMKEL